MKLLLQRVLSASVTVDGNIVGRIDNGLLVFVGFEKSDNEIAIDPMAKKLLNYRIFSDQDDKMNNNIQQINGELLVVSQFTLSADTKKGLRPSFSSALSPNSAEVLYNAFVQTLKPSGLKVATGIFGADMQVQLVNDGPVTFILES